MKIENACGHKVSLDTLWFLFHMFTTKHYHTHIPYFFYPYQQSMPQMLISFHFNFYQREELN